jgi:type VI secretion system protein ImpE
MRAEEHLQSGDLEQALTVLQEEIRSNPSKADLRVFLFQLLSVLGQWDRAMTQLNVAADMNSETMLMAQVYRIALNCEVFRADVFKGKRTPLIFGEPLAWVGWLTQVPGLLAEGNIEAAAKLRDQAFEAAPETSGVIDGQEFSWIADADPRLGPMIEAIVNGKYYWIPFERIREIRIEKPANLRDIVWATATFTWTNSGEAVGLIPVRYPGSEKSEDNLIRMGRKTDWKDIGNDFYLGTGQRMLTSDQGDFSLLETRQIILNHPTDDPPGEHRQR